MEIFGIPLPMDDDTRSAIDRSHMQDEATRHDIARLFEELTKEQLTTVRIILHQICSDGDGRLAAYYEGVTSQTLILKYGVCGDCGRNHDNSLDEIRDVLDVADVSENEVKKAKDKLLGLIKKGLEIEVDIPVTDEPDDDLSLDDFENMRKYNLDDLRDAESLELMGFVCKNCGIQYPSIEDRMLRRVDDCHGCHLKSAHG